MRWIALWLLLTATLLVGCLVSALAVGRSTLDREALSHLAMIPAVQVLALWVLRFVRRAGS